MTICYMGAAWAMKRRKVRRGRVRRCFKWSYGFSVKQLLLASLQMPQAGGGLALLLNSTTAINYPLS